MKRLLLFLMLLVIHFASSAQTQTPNEVIGNSQVVCGGATPAKIVQISIGGGSFDPTKYDWYRKRYVSGAWQTSWSTSLGTAYEYSPPASTYNEVFYRNRWEYNPETGGWTGREANSNRVYILKNLVLNEGTIGSTQNIAYNTAPALLTSITDATSDILPNIITNALTYQWWKSDDINGWQQIAGATSKDYQPPALIKTTLYKRRAKTACFDKESNTITVSVYAPFTAAVIGINQNLCFDVDPSQITETTAPTGGSGSISYQWEVSTDNATFTPITAETDINYTPPFVVGTRYYRRLTIDPICGSIPTNSVQIVGYPDATNGVIQPEQAINYNTQPQILSIKTAPTGGDGSGFTYVWQVSTDNTNFSDIPAAIGTSYIPPVLTSDRWYRLKSTNPCKTVYSPSILIHVYPELKAAKITGAQAICYNTTPSLLSVEENPTGGSENYSLLWTVSVDGVNFTDIPTATGVSYQPNLLTNTMYYQVKVIDTYCGTVKSNIIMVDVKPDLYAGLIGENQNICYDTNPTNIITTANPTGSFGGYTYQWEKLDGVNWVDIENETNANYQPPKLKTTSIYRRSVKSGTCSEKYSNVVTITVKNEFLAGSIGSNQVINYGFTPNIINTISPASGGSANFSYQWQQSTNNTTYSDIFGATTESYQSGALYDTTYFRRVTTDQSCGSKFTNVVTIFVNLSLNGGSISDNQTICFDTKPAKIVGTAATGGMGAFEYKWMKSLDNSTYSEVVGATEKDYQPNNLSQSTYFKRLASLGGQTVESNKVFIEVRPALAEPNTDLKERYCKNAHVAINVVPVEVGIKYNWYDASNLNILIGSQLNISSFATDTDIRVEKEDALGCRSTKKLLNLRVDEVKAVFSADKTTIKQGEMVTFTNSSVNGATYAWDFGDGVQSTEAQPSYYYQKLVNMSTTVYGVSLAVTSPFGCLSSEVKQNYITVNPTTTAVEDGKLQKVRFSPNPFSSSLTISAEQRIERLDIFAITGEKVSSFNGSENTLVVNLSQLANGIYFARIFGNNGLITTSKIVKSY